MQVKGHRSGFVNIVGNPNVGKSTLMNRLVGERISIITAKAQTTRHRIIGIVNRPEYQVVYSDTPGVLRPNYKLQESMLKFSSPPWAMLTCCFTLLMWWRRWIKMTSSWKR